MFGEILGHRDSFTAVESGLPCNSESEAFQLVGQLEGCNRGAGIKPSRCPPKQDVAQRGVEENSAGIGVR